MNLIVPEDGKGNMDGGRGIGRMNYVKLIGKGEMGFRGDFKKTAEPEREGLEEWCSAYCEDSAGIKQ